MTRPTSPASGSSGRRRSTTDPPAGSTTPRSRALLHPGHSAAARFAPAPGDRGDEAVSPVAAQIIADVPVAYEPAGDDAIDPIRAFRSVPLWFVALGAGGGFGLPVGVDRSFERLIQGVVTVFARAASGRRPGQHGHQPDEPGANQGRHHATAQAEQPDGRRGQHSHLPEVGQLPSERDG